MNSFEVFCNSTRSLFLMSLQVSECIHQHWLYLRYVWMTKNLLFSSWFYQLMWFHHCSLSTDFCGFYSWCIHEIDSSLKYGTYDNDLCWLRAIMSKHLHVLKALIPMNIYETAVSYALTQTKLVWAFIDTTLKSIQLKWFW